MPKTLAKAPGDGAYWAEIRITTKLDGYDAKPVSSYDRWLFRPNIDGQRYLLASTTDKEWEDSHDTGTEPWDVEHVYVDEYGSVLGIFDSRTAAHADRVVEAVSEAKDDDSLVIPESLQPSAGLGTVVYMLSDQRMINGLSGSAVGNPAEPDGLTIAIPADVNDASAGTAAYRVAFNPSDADQPAMVFDRLIRHEMTHATLGAHTQGVPTWLNEGIAEYVSVQNLPRSERRLPSDALAVGATAQSLPTTEDFAGADAPAWYGVSWWVCQYIANTYGQRTLWTLFEQLSGGADQDQVIPSLLHITPEVLVRRGVDLMTSTYSS
ncbi:MAG: hypothetical protein FWE71_06190 [Nocardioidaceae bacterium]|nr:hypothetical protein [Nocardioidaceae bacterium]MCL2611804.1 hypothetical protein [Nocardioidaceae bacterium]